MVLVDHPSEGVRRVRLARPARRNAIDGALLDRLGAALRDGDEPVAVLGSDDPRAFCAGADLGMDAAEFLRVSNGLYELYEWMVGCDRVFVAAVDGPAIGAGAQLLLASDLRIGGPAARIGFSGAAGGLAVGTWGLASLVGQGHAMDLSLTGRSIDADEAIRWGLLDRLVDDPDAEARRLCREIAAAPHDVLADVKRLTTAATGLQDRIEAERLANRARHHADIS